MKVAVVTDTGSGIGRGELPYDNLYIISLPYMIDGEEYGDNNSLTNEQFYDKLKDKSLSFKTSQPSIYAVADLWDSLLKEYDEIVHIPLSCELSASYNQALRLANDEYSNKVFVVNNKKVSIPQKTSVIDAVNMAADGYSASEIATYLENEGKDSMIYILVDDLSYLKKGGRITAQAAALGSLLHIKPILMLADGKIDAFKKVMSASAAKKVMVSALVSDITEKYQEYYDNGSLEIAIAHADFIEGANQLKDLILKKLPDANIKFVDYLSPVIACHTGNRTLGIAYYRVYKK